MREGEYGKGRVPVVSHALDIPARLKELDEGYFVMLNRKTQTVGISEYKYYFTDEVIAIRFVINWIAILIWRFKNGSNFKRWNK